MVSLDNDIVSTPLVRDKPTARSKGNSHLLLYKSRCESYRHYNTIPKHYGDMFPGPGQQTLVVKHHDEWIFGKITRYNHRLTSQEIANLNKRHYESIDDHYKDSSLQETWC